VSGVCDSESVQVHGLVFRGIVHGRRCHEIPTVEVAEGLEHRMSPGKGRGLFATRSFAGGDVVLANRPLAVAEQEAAFVTSLSDSVMSTSTQVLDCMQTNGCIGWKSPVY
jgi:hypothetical protein